MEPDPTAKYKKLEPDPTAKYKNGLFELISYALSLEGKYTIKMTEIPI